MRNYLLIFLLVFPLMAMAQPKEGLKWKEAIKNPSEVNILNLAYSKFQELPDEIERFQNLEKIYLYRCNALDWEDAFKKLSKLPKLRYISFERSGMNQVPRNIGKLLQVEEMNFKSNYIPHFPSSFFKLPNLKRLNLQQNLPLQFKNLQNISKLKGLEELNLSYGGWEEFPEELSQIPHLKKLDLSGNVFAELPPNFFNLKGLKWLNLSSCPNLKQKTLFQSLKGLSSLEYLDLHYSEIEALDPSIGELKNLRFLDLTDNLIWDLPSSLGQCTLLEELRLGNSSSRFDNKIQTVPGSFANMTKMKRFIMNRCELTSLPECLSSMPDLEYLDLSWNRIEFWTESPIVAPNLWHINLNHNTISEVPQWIGNLTGLVELHLRADFWSPHDKKLRQLPASICQLKKLKKLNLEEHYLESLPSCLGQLQSLEYLNLKNTWLNALPAGIGNCQNLQHLNLRSTELRKIPDDLFDLKALKHLDFSLLRRLKLSQYESDIVKLSSLNWLDISFSDIDSANAQQMRVQLPDCKIEHRMPEKGKKGPERPERVDPPKLDRSDPRLRDKSKGGSD